MDKDEPQSSNQRTATLATAALSALVAAIICQHVNYLNNHLLIGALFVGLIVGLATLLAQKLVK